MDKGGSEDEAAQAINLYVTFKQRISSQVWQYANELITHKIKSQMIGLSDVEAENLKDECLLQVSTDMLTNVPLEPEALHSLMVLVFKEKYGETS